MWDGGTLARLPSHHPPHGVRRGLEDGLWWDLVPFGGMAWFCLYTWRAIGLLSSLTSGAVD